MATVEDTQAAQQLVGQAATHVGRVSGRKPLRAALQWVTRGTLGRDHGWPSVPILGTPWHDTISPERRGWRQRAAYPDGDHAFAVDYQTCRRCRLGWVEHPYTDERYQRCGLASAGPATLRAEHPGLAWHTLGGHFPDSRAFWAAVGADVPGSYQQRPVCSHVTSG